jgi:GT2 family glycosyltransferase
MKVSAILVNYNAGEELRRALQSIADEMHRQPWEAVVVDNASTDGSQRLVREFAPHARLIMNPANVGFARAVNQGLAATTAPRVLIMNPDCRLVAGAIVALNAVLDQHDFCAIAAPRILNPDGSLQGSARGDPDVLTGLFGRSAVLGRLLPGLPAARRNVVSESALRSGQQSVVVDWLSGACMLAQRAALKRVNGFDERYFLYWEDADLCRRLRAAGYHVRYVPGATAIHRVGHSSRTARAASIRAFHDSAYLYYATHNAPERMRARRALAKMILASRQWWLLLGARG